MSILKNGIFSLARFVASPNYDERPPSCDISLIVIHAISLPPDNFGSDDILAFFTNCLDPHKHPFFATIAAQKVSTHFLIRRGGETIQFVSCDKRAWHAGKSSFLGRERCNDFSIGIELEGSDTQPFEAAQYQTLNALIAELAAHYPITHLTSHSHIAPTRKTDPGPFFEWQALSLLKRIALIR